jgi:non-heme chloroperoxidase
MSDSTFSPLTSLTASERAQLQRANASGLQPVMFLHGLWLLAGSWQHWAEAFEEAGYIALTPGWPGEPDTVAEANARPESMVQHSLGQVAEHHAALAGLLQRKPVLVGHSFGGLLAQMLAGRGLSVATVAIAPAPFRGVLPLPLAALRSAWPVLGNPANRHKAVALSAEQFRFAFANAVGESEALDLHARFAVPAPGAPLFQVAVANINPWSEAQVDTANAGRGPLLIVSGDQDHTVPPAICNAALRLQRDNPGLTETLPMRNRGHSLTLDGGWREVCDAVLGFVRRFAPADMFEAAYLGDEADRREEGGVSQLELDDAA